MKNNSILINEDIPGSRVIVIDMDGNKKGEFLREDAIQLANQSNLDLVMVGFGELPICKIMDFGKYLYHQKKKAKNNGGSQVKQKEIKLTPVTDHHDLFVKISKIKEFLNKDYKVKVTVEFKGRHNHHKDQGFEKCQQIINEISDVGVLDGNIQSIGQHMFMSLIAK